MLLGLETIKKGSKLLIGLSGGVDSMSLLYALLDIAKCYDFSLHAMYINHNLRDESKEEAIALEKICYQLGVVYHKKSIAVKREAKARKESIEAIAHHLRFEAFEAVIKKEKIDYLVLGHTRDDRAESFLINLLYGAGLNGLSPLPLFDGKIWRPLIETPKERLFFYAEEKGFTYFHDSSNDSLEYFRNQVRHEILPFLSTYQPKISQKLAHSAAHLYESKMALITLAEEYLTLHLIKQENGAKLKKENLLKTPIGLLKMILLRLLASYVPEARGLNEKKWETLIDILFQNEAKRLLVRGNWWFESTREWLFLKEMTNAEVFAWNEKKMWSKALRLPLGKLEETTKPKGLFTCGFDEAIFIRFRQARDKVFIKGLGHKSLKKLFQEKGLLLESRAVWPIIVNREDEILWIPEIYKNDKNQAIIKPKLMLKWSLGDKKEE